MALATKVFDEQGKLNVRMLGEGTPERRALWKERLKRLLLEVWKDTDFALTESEADTWANQVTEYAAGGPIRATIPTPSTADNRKILLLDELDFLPEVRGTKFGALLADRREGEEVGLGLHRYLTVHGTGKVNLNTVELPLLRAFFPQNPELADPDPRAAGQPAERGGGRVGRERGATDADEEARGIPSPTCSRSTRWRGWTPPPSRRTRWTPAWTST